MIMERKKKKRVLIVVGLLALLLSVPAWFAFRVGILPRIDHTESFHAPVFSPDGQEIYYLSRKAWGVSWGPGIEFFTPPASVIVLGDRFALQKTNRETGETRTIHEWSVAHLLQPVKTYRNYLFGIPEGELRWDGRTLHYKIGLDFLPNDPPGLSVKEWTRGSWNADSNSLVEQELWKSGYYQPNPWTEQILLGPLEVINYKNQALVLYDSVARKRTTLRFSGSGGPGLREELATFDLAVYAHREQLERSRTIRETYGSLVIRFRSQGLPEGEAMLRANDEMERLGYFPRSPKLLAARIDGIPQDVKVFEITSDEFRFGLFPDIEAALAKPGTEVAFHGKYIRHRDFGTSDRLNEHLDSGNRSFIVKHNRALYRISVIK
jgi:hypothetical protein